MNTAMHTLVMEPPATYKAVAPPDAAITGRIHNVRGQKVMLDRDLAELYGVQVKVLKQAVRRNLERFPEDFMFELTIEEAAGMFKVTICDLEHASCLKVAKCDLETRSEHQVRTLRLYRARHTHARERASQRTGHRHEHSQLVPP